MVADAGSAGPLAKAINRMYIDGRLVSLTNWSAIRSAQANFPYPGAGPILANTPWSGHYAVGKEVWGLRAYRPIRGHRLEVPR